ncbi:MAG TPA: spore coat protein U domain-containing protein [Stellaceae bacterium]|nr:spore coat protein U domain-containing protein [Stellaceae bacterium]
MQNFGCHARLAHILTALTATTAATVVLLAAPEPAYSAGSANVTLAASLPANCSISLAAPASGASFTSGGGNNRATWTVSSSSGTTTLGIATLNETCNQKYDVTISASNGGTLLGSAGNTDKLTYSLIYDVGGQNTTFTPSTGGTLVGNNLKKTGNNGTNKAISLILQNAFVTADTYTDTLTITQTAP